MILLDTCTLLWLVGDQKKISSKARKSIKENAHTLFVSAISAFEIALKNRSKKLKLELDPLIWFKEVLDFHGITELPLTSDTAVLSVNLPLLHNDPCDRIIVATAQLNNLKIITCDKYILQYKEARVIW